MEREHSDHQQEAKRKLGQVFRYLEALNQVRNPVQREIARQPWTLWLRELPDHPTVQWGHPTTPSEDEAPAFILKVRRPELTRAPEPPGDLARWLKPGWQQPAGRVAVDPVLRQQTEQGDPIEIAFDAEPARRELLEAWRLRWEAWAERERPARQAMTVFENLFDLQARLEREAERIELVMGEGLLTWSRPVGERVHHPIMIQRLALEFDPDLPEFTLVESDRPIELYSALFRAMPEVNPTAIGRIREELERDQWPLLGGEETNSFLRRVASQLEKHGRFHEDRAEQPKGSEPLIVRDPVLFLRARNLGFAVALEAILADLQSREQIPAALSKIVGIEPPTSGDQPADLTDPDDAPNGEDETVLLSKPANAEQLQIARRLDRHGAVLVQGPPGTGKTHTIANLLGHLLAQGKSVLVTSHTAKALKVLKEKVVEPLQPLCVSAVEEGSADLEATIDAITERLGSLSADTLEREAAALTRDRLALLHELRQTRERLKLARADEYRPVVVAGEEHPPSLAARQVQAGARQHAWIPAPVRLGDPLPLSAAEVHDLYATNRLISTEDEQELGVRLPEPSRLPGPAEFDAMLRGLQQLTERNLNFRGDLWQSVPETQTAEALTDLYQRLVQAMAPLGDHGWQLAVVAAGREGRAYSEAWVELLREIERVVELAAEAHLTTVRHGPELPPGMPAAEAARILDEMLLYLRDGGTLGTFKLLLNGEWKRLIGAARVGGQRPAELAQFEALRTVAALAIARQNLAARWQRQVTAVGGPDAAALGPEPEGVCRQYSPAIERCLHWYQQIWLPLEAELQQQGLLWQRLLEEAPVNPAPHGELQRLALAVRELLLPVIDAQSARLAWLDLQQRLARLTAYLETFGGDEKSLVADRLHQAVVGRNGEAYRSAFQRLNDLHARRAALESRRELLARLEGAAPAWSAAIRNREGIHGGSEVPGDAQQAWLWRQLHGELERRSRVSLDALQGRIAQFSTDLQRLTAELAEKKAWAAQVRRTTLTQRQALNGYKLLMKKVGKRTGKRVPEYLAEARKLMPVCQTAVPAWIMPLSRVVDSFDLRQNRFDVIIIDEASQADILALTALYMGSQVVVVGDDEQVSPMSIGTNTDDVIGLIAEHLTGIPNAKLYDGLCSIYDLAGSAFEPVSLREHFRCVAPIIAFSNQLSYEQKIRPLRDESLVIRRPPTVAYRVEGGASLRKVNDLEALTLASLLVAATELPEYDGATFGVISLLGDEQARRIDRLLQRHLGPRAYRERRLLCGNAAEFQGDERDVIFLSMVETGRDDGGRLARRAEGPGNMYKKRYNVAASRARDQLWVVHSLNHEHDLKDGDIRLRLIQHALDPSAVTAGLAVKERQTESEFERLVLRQLESAGYRATPQWQVGAYRIDMVVEGNGRRLAVECDGDRWHPVEKLGEDMARQAILERLGWRFVRIRGSEFFRDAGAAMEPVFRRLRELEIPPMGPDVAEDRAGEAAELRERIVRRAAALREMWAEADEASPDAPLARVAAAVPVPAPAFPCRLGAFFVVRDARGEEYEYELVGPGRGDLDRGRVSADSPLGRAVNGKRAGAIIEVFAPDGKSRYDLVDVRDPALE